MQPVDSTAGVVDDAADFYGERYWLRHQAESFGFPSIEERARADLPERCLHWLKTLLRYRRPPATLLEVGASHGGFVRLAELAGFQSVGIEMSPSIVDYARQAFGIDMRVGPLESLSIADEACDVIASFDVLEHFRDPEAALRTMRHVLRSDGLLLIQTPKYPATSAEALRSANDRFLEHLRAPEHVYLFSPQAVREILRRTGFPFVTFEPPIFAYDMFFVAGSTRFDDRSPDDAATSLLATANGRIALALLDLATERDDLRNVAAERMAVIEGLKQACDERLALIQQLDAKLRALS